GDAWMVVPGNRGQVVSRLELTVRGGGPLTDAIGAGAAAQLGAELDARIDAAAKELAGFQADATADPAFVAQKQQELAAMRAERKALDDQPLRIPAAGSWFTLTQVKIRKDLACDAAVQDAKLAYDHAAGEANVAAAKLQTVPPPPPGKAGYVGVEECATCHAKEATFWEQTHHAQAFATLEQVGKQFDYECISCHVTGWNAPGGAALDTEELRNVQCEVCHGPGSLHAEAENDADFRKTIVRAPAAELCAQQCHTAEHSDTFDYEAYLRDVTGPGHGGKRRKELGDGPTGHELRAAGLAKAGKEIGAGCRK
ncbi:MAG: hypothetical protein KC464_14380, partial [Myxococcales bacterium]|nr:hypothetical protein [Myxococcales bacterium]